MQLTALVQNLLSGPAPPSLSCYGAGSDGKLGRGSGRRLLELGLFECVNMQNLSQNLPYFAPLSSAEGLISLFLFLALFPLPLFSSSSSSSLFCCELPPTDTSPLDTNTSSVSANHTHTHTQRSSQWDSVTFTLQTSSFYTASAGDEEGLGTTLSFTILLY